MEWFQTDGSHHRCGDTDNGVVFTRNFDDLVGKYAGPAETCRSNGESRFGVNRPNGVEAISDVFFGGSKTASLLGDDVDKNGIL